MGSSAGLAGRRNKNNTQNEAKKEDFTMCKLTFIKVDCKVTAS